MLSTARGRNLRVFVREALRTRLWPLPAMGVAAALVLGFVLPEVDRAVDADLPPGIAGYLFGGDANAARVMVSAIAGSLITVTSLTFSLTVVTLQLASSQFSPRLLRTFTRDLTVQLTLALFLATFTYSLTVLRTVRTAGDSIDVFVPQLSITWAFVMTVASVLSLVLFLAHLAQQIRVETMLRDVHVDGTEALERLLPDSAEPAQVPPALPRPPADAVPVLAGRSGFLVRVADEQILHAAVETDGVVVIERPTGASVVAGTPVAWVWPRTGTWQEGECAQLAGVVAGSMHLGYERTQEQDVALSLRQLTDVAVKALSPGINDPTTAVHALSHTSALLCQLAERRLGPLTLTDDDEIVRVVVARPELAEFLDEAVSEPRRFGADDPRVLGRLFQLLREVAWCLPPEARRPITEQLSRLRVTAAGRGFDSAERTALEEAAARVEVAVQGRWLS